MHTAIKPEPKANTDEAGLVDGGPPLRLLRLWGPYDSAHRHVWGRALLLAAVGWLPLLLLALLAHLEGRQGVWLAFLHDTSVHSRTLLVAPLLVLAEAHCIPRLGALAQIFRQRGLVPEAQLGAYEAIVRSILRQRDSWLAEVVAVVLAYVAALLIVRYVPPSFLPDWHLGIEAAPFGRSLASWWNALISLPILIILILGWAWRLWLWARYLWRVSRLPLRLLASHPEGSAGLMFLSESLPAFSLLGAALGILVAATELAHVSAGGIASAEQLGGFAIGTVLFALLVFGAPLTAFTLPLLHCRHAAIASYGALIQRVGGAFEDKWLSGAPVVPAAALESGDFSAVADLYGTASQVYELRLLPIELRSLLVLAAATALPFGVVALALMPFDKLLDKLLGMFL